MKKQAEPTAMARLLTPPRWQYTRALLVGASPAATASVRTSAKASRSTPSGLQAGLLGRLEQSLDHRATRGHEHHLHARAAVGRLGVAGDLVVEHGLVERHRDGLGRLEADRGVALLLVLDARELDHAHDDLLVRHAEPDVLGEPGLGDEVLERLGQTVAVHDLAVGARGPSGSSRLAPRTTRPAIDLGSGEIAAVDVETDDALI